MLRGLCQDIAHVQFWLTTKVQNNKHRAGEGIKILNTITVLYLELALMPKTAFPTSQPLTKWSLWLHFIPIRNKTQICFEIAFRCSFCVTRILVVFFYASKLIWDFGEKTCLSFSIPFMTFNICWLSGQADKKQV